MLQSSWSPSSHFSPDNHDSKRLRKQCQPCMRFRAVFILQYEKENLRYCKLGTWGITVPCRGVKPTESLQAPWRQQELSISENNTQFSDTNPCISHKKYWWWGEEYMQKATGTQRKQFCLSNNLLQTQNQMCSKLPASRQRFPPSWSVLLAMTAKRTLINSPDWAGLLQLSPCFLQWAVNTAFENSVLYKYALSHLSNKTTQTQDTWCFNHLHALLSPWKSQGALTRAQPHVFYLNHQPFLCFQGSVSAQQLVCTRSAFRGGLWGVGRRLQPVPPRTFILTSPLWVNLVWIHSKLQHNHILP